MTHLTDPGLIPRRQFFEVPDLIDWSKDDIDLLIRGNELNIKDREAIKTKKRKSEASELIKATHSLDSPEIASNLGVKGSPEKPE